MPLHEYECEACGHRFEKIQKFSDPPIEVCPKCGGHVRKLISSPAFQFKGSGWYVTDYAKKDSSSGAGKSEGGTKEDKSGEKSDKTEAPKEKESTAKSDTTSSSSASDTSSSASDKPKA